MEKRKVCLLDAAKQCNDCGECDRCDIDPGKLCDNCMKCIAIDDKEEFRSMLVSPETVSEGVKLKALPRKGKTAAQSKREAMGDDEIADEPLTLDPELVAYWERVLAGYGEAPADDGLGEIEVDGHNNIRGVRKHRPRK